MFYLVMKFKGLLLVLVIGLICSAFLLSSSSVIRVKAQSGPLQNSLQVQGLGIDPFLFELDMSAGQSTTQTITLINTTNKPLSFQASIHDFVPQGNTGQPRFLSSSEESDSKYSLSRWITIIKQPEFTLPPQAKTEITFAINIPANVEPGTHYGGILFGQPISQIEGSSSAAEQKAGAIILVRLGRSNEQISIENFASNKKIYSHGPVEFTTTLHNFGNVHSRPKGEVTVRNIWGRQVTQLPVNKDALIVLPESKRVFPTEWSNKLGFGRYTAEEVLFYGSPKVELRAQTSFWILPLKEIVLGSIIALIFAIISYILIRRYNRYIINRAKHG